MQLEVDFFSAQPLATDHWPGAADTFLVMDFDETMTQADSTAAIIETAISAAAARHGGLAACECSSLPDVACLPACTRPPAILEMQDRPGRQLAGLVAHNPWCSVTHKRSAAGAGEQERQRLEALRDELVANHSAKRRELLDSLLPVVGHHPACWVLNCKICCLGSPFSPKSAFRQLSTWQPATAMHMCCSSLTAT